MVQTEQEGIREKLSIQIILESAPQLVQNIINILHILKLASAGDWLVVKRSKNPPRLTVTIKLHYWR